MLKVYRGLSLPAEAIKYYEERLEDQEGFRFNGFTSTSTSRDVAKGFALGGSKEGNVPVLFEIFLIPDYGMNKKYLDSDNLSAYPHEKELLLGDQAFNVVKGKGNFQKDEEGVLTIQLFG